MNIVIVPATPERWEDLAALFGPHGAYGGCWCMFWRLSRSEFDRLPGNEKRAALQDVTLRGEVPGLLAYSGEQPVGWCSVAPRTAFGSLERSRTLKRIDDQPVWSIVCFFIAKVYRQQGMMVKLLRGAIDYAAGQGARIVEGYPIDTQPLELVGKRLSSDGGYMGIVSAFREAGFVEARRVSEARLIMRYRIAGR